MTTLKLKMALKPGTVQVSPVVIVIPAKQSVFGNSMLERSFLCGHSVCTSGGCLHCFPEQHLFRKKKITRWIFLFSKCRFPEKQRCFFGGLSRIFRGNIPLTLVSWKWAVVRRISLTSGRHRALCKWGPTQLMFKYLDGIDQANRLLNKICPSL